MPKTRVKAIPEFASIDRILDDSSTPWRTSTGDSTLTEETCSAWAWSTSLDRFRECFSKKHLYSNCVHMLQGMLPSQRRLRRRHGSQACFALCRFCEGGLVSLFMSVEVDMVSSVHSRQCHVRISRDRTLEGGGKL
jgi:hypothetical protein